MASTEHKPLEILVKTRGRPIKHLPPTTYALPNDNGRNLYERIAAKARVSVDRIRVTKASDGSLVPNERDNTIEELGFQEGSAVFVKDLGAQVGWTTVFLLEYAGPIVAHAIIYYGRETIYKNPKAPFAYPPPSLSAKLSFAMVVTHFAKRLLETLFVHRFSNATMPIFPNIFKNLGHYWGVGGVILALFTYSPAKFCPTSHDPPYEWLPYLASALFVVGELGNFSAHLTLMNLRSKGSKARGIPVTGVFSFIPVTCPNYFFETIAWIGVLLANRSLSTVLFMILAVGQMYLWALKKESRYRKEFGSRYKKKRAVIIPWIL